MKKIQTKKIRSKQCDEWIRLGKAVLRNDLRPVDMEGFFDFYRLDDGGLLLRVAFERRNGIRYQSYADYLTLLEKRERRNAINEQYPQVKDASFSNYLRIPVTDFKEKISVSGELLERAFDLPPKTLDYSLKSLNTLGQVIKKYISKTDEEFEENYMMLLSAYCGEVMRRVIDGEWKITGNKDGIVHKILITEKGKPEFIYMPAISLYKILAGDVKAKDLQIEIDAQLHKYGFIRSNEKHYGLQ